MHHTNPFTQHALRHGQTLLHESNRVSSLSQAMVSACDEMVMSISSGNIQGAANSAQNCRMMAVQLAQSSQELNRAFNERIETAAYVLNRIQSHVNELSNAMQSMRGVSGMSYHPQIHTPAPYQQANTAFM